MYLASDPPSIVVPRLLGNFLVIHVACKGTAIEAHEVLDSWIVLGVVVVPGL